MTNLVSVKYVGHLGAVDIDLDGLGERTLVKGETVKVTEEMALSLLEQPNNWQLVESNLPKKAEEAK